MSLTRGDKRIALYPSDHFKVTYSIAFDHPLLRHQSRTIRLTEESFVDEIAPARTFTFLKEVEMLRQQGLALGGSLENAIVIGDTGVLNNALRFDDEFVRHKILDVIGDMALVGHPIIGHLVAHRGGHALHTAFAAQVLEERDAWTLVEVRAVCDAGAAGRCGGHAAGQGRRYARRLTLRPAVSDRRSLTARVLLASSLPHVGFELVVLVLHRIEEQALQQVGPPLVVVHLVDEVGDLAHHVLERALQLPPGGDLAVERLHDREQVAVERDLGAGRRLDGAHGLGPEALDGRRLVGVDLEEVLRAGHRQHRLDALLHARQLQRAARGASPAGTDPSGSRSSRCRRR